MKRNSDYLYLESPGSNGVIVTPVRWVNNAPVFDEHFEPTRSVLEKSYNDYIAAGGVIEVIPDPVEVIDSNPVLNWNGFYDQLIMSGTYNYLLSQTIPYPSISGVMAVMGFSIQNGKDDPLNPNRLEALKASVAAILGALNAINLPLSTEQLAEVRTLLDSNGFAEVSLGE